MFFLLLFTVLVSLVTITTCYIKWAHQYWARKKLPFVPPKFPFGNLQSPRTRKYPIGVHIRNIYKTMKSKGLKHCGLYFFASPVYLILDMEYLKNVMIRDFQHFVDRGMYYNEKADPISAHLFAIGGSKWKHLRTKLTPTFTSGKMKMMFPTLVECVSILLETMSKQENPLDVKEILGRFTTDIIGSCAFGLDCNTIKEDNSPFRLYGKKVFESSKLRYLKMTFATNFPRLGRLFGIRQVSSEISHFFTEIVKETIKYRELNDFKRNDFMQLLIEMKNKDEKMTIEEVVAQAFIFFLAGFETSSTTMTFALYELANNTKIQEKLRQEIEDILEKTDGKITYESITEMKYLDQVIEESLRKYPPLPFITRTCVKDYPIPGTDVVLEKGVRVIVPIIGIHYDEEFYPEPEKFQPDRFSEENKRTRPSLAYLAFGEGPRICIGMRFGLMQTKVGLVSLLRNYRFTVNPKTKEPLTLAVNSFILNAAGGIWLDSHKI